MDINNTIITHYLTRNDYNEVIVRERLVVPIVYLILLLLIGLPGNISILVIYKNYNKNVYIKIIWTIAVLDLVFCLIGIPFNLSRMFNYYNFKSLISCQIVVGILDSGIISSTHLLVLLTIHRFRQVCYPLKRQITLKSVAYFIGICFAIGVALGIPQIAVSQPFAETDLGNNVTGYTCSVAWKDSPQAWKNYNVFLTFLFLFYTSLLFILYIMIGRTIHKQNKRRKTELNMLHSGKSTVHSHKMTKIAITVSAVFALSSLPLYINEWATKGLDENKLDLFTFSLLKIAQRSYLINHVANPFIYATFDKGFRKQLAYILTCKTTDDHDKGSSDTESSNRKLSTSATLT
ncbi:GPR10 [Mytilus edulis]|uniref:PRLHR n=1 Tax=Mytilus edulis TaxID=6550 RepID=A0A8S3Q5D7_MYTED|nr:GPR10 [Mytilus edulis]